MKYYSEALDKLFDTEAALNEAEAAVVIKEQEKRRRTEELDAARKIAEEAENKYAELLGRYCKDYGHYSYPDDDKSSADVLAKLLEQIGIHIL